MGATKRRVRAVLLAGALLVGLAAPLATVPEVQADESPRPAEPASEARADLHADAEPGVSITQAPDGGVTFVGSDGRGIVDNPEVGAGDSVRTAARDHLDRYGAALKAAEGSTFTQTSARRLGSGTDVVRLQQQVDGVPVFGGQVVMDLGVEHDLRSLTSSVTAADGAVRRRR